MTEHTSPQVTLSVELVIHNEHGLHARPAAELVKAVKAWKSEIIITNLDGSGIGASGRSMMKVISLGVKKGHRLNITASGEDAAAAINAITQAITSGLGE